MSAPVSAPPSHPAPKLAKAPTDIPGFDEIAFGGLPRGRVTLVIGGPGTGKTVFALEVLVNGARDHQEPGVFVAFEENTDQIVANAATFGWDLPGLEQARLFFLDARLPPTIVQAGDFDLSGMLAMLDAKVQEMGAKRIVFDGVDVLLTLLNDPVAERRELYRLYEWLQARKLTGILTAKASEGDRPSTERYAFMQFMVDCVVILQHRLLERVSLRSLRIMKYRGSAFAENEFPIIISPSGVEVSTFGTSVLDYEVSTDRVSSGVPRLDTMLDGGYYRGSGVLVSGSPGTSKTTLAAAFVAASCDRGERALFVSFDEAAQQLVRNLRSVGIDLGKHVDSGLLCMHSIRTEAKSAEEHLVDIQNRIRDHQPKALVLDPISALAKTGGHIAAVHASLRVLDLAKSLGITVICTSLVATDDAVAETTSTQISTIADTWIHLSYVVHGGERNRALTIVKSRGMKHSNQVRELILGKDGITLTDVYSAGGEVLVGTARWERETQLREAERRSQIEADRQRALLELAEAEIDARMTALQHEREARRAEMQAALVEQREQMDQKLAMRHEVNRRRGGEHEDGDGGQIAPPNADGWRPVAHRGSEATERQPAHRNGASVPPRETT
jgi:circadian clock protein KaiC